MKALSYYPLCLTYQLNHTSYQRTIPVAGPCQWEAAVLCVVRVSKKDPKKNLGSYEPKGVNRHVRRRRLVQVVCLDFQNTFDKGSLWKP